MRKSILFFITIIVINLTMFNSAKAQGVITTTTTFSNNNGSGVVTFNFQNTSTSPIAITDIAGVTGTNGPVSVELWYSTTPVNGSPGVISTANGWVQEATGSITGIANTSTTTTQPFFTGLNFVIPANTTYGIAVYADGQRYFTMTNNVQTFTDLGCNLITGPNISYGGGAPNGSAPSFTPRGWIGTINFVNLAPCSGAPTAGTASAPAAVCANQQFNLSLSGQSMGSGLNYQWLSAPSATGPWTPIAGATTWNEPVSQTSDTYYACEVVCTNSSLADTTAAIFVQTNPNLPAGTYTIGASGTYPNFTAAVAAMSCGIAGPVVFNVLTGSGPYNEQIEIPQIINSSATNTITFNGNGETITYSTTGSSDNYLIRLNGADYITFDSLNVVTQSSTNNFAIHLTNDADFNTINNCNIDLTSTLSSTFSSNAGIVISGSLTSATSTGASGTNNTITNNTITGGYYGLTLNGASSTTESVNNTISGNTIQDFYYYATYLRSLSNSVISNNDIHRMNRLTVSSFYGLYFITSGSRNLIEANEIHDAYTGTITANSSVSYPIYHTGVDVAVVGDENRVVNNLIYNINNNGTIYGIYNSSSDGVHYYHNTISLDDANATAGTTRGFYQTSTASNIEFKNNIISVTRGGTGSKHCIYYGSSTSVINSNNNVFYMNAPAGTNNLGYSGGDQSNIGLWQTATSGDANSSDADPIFANPSSGQFAPINAAIDGIADASVNVLTDIYGVTRSATPDPGAIEFTPPSCPQPSNLSASNITGTTIDLSWTENGTATVWDIEWGTVGFTPTGIPNITGTTTNPHSLTGLTPLTDYDFYVRAYCSASDTSFWSGPYTFSTLCAVQLSGTYTIGTAGNYLTFTDAINDMVTCGIAGPVVFNVIAGSGPFNEQITIPYIINSSATNTITFNGNGEMITSTTTSSARSIILLDGANHITFDNLVVQTQSTTNNFAIQLINDADSNTINNCVIDLTSAITSTSSTNAAIVVSGSLTSATTAGASGAYNTITNNHIIGGYYGITVNGASSTNGSMNNTIDSNLIEDFYFYGTYLSNISNSSISFNDLSRPNRTSLSSFYGLYFTTGGEGNTIEGNKIHDPFRALGGVSTSTSYLIYHSNVDATVGNENRVINNLIYNINSNGSIYALYNTGSDGVHYYHNTISLDDQNAIGGLARGFYQTTTASNIVFKNNIVTVTRSGGGAMYCLYFNATGSAIVSDNNVLYTPTGINNTGYYGGNQNTLTNWQTATTGDANSVAADPLYVNLTANNFMPSSPLVDGIADASANVTTDIFGITRSATPDPGAIEFIPPSCPQPSNLTAINVTSNTANLSWLETGSATTWQIDWDTAGVAQGLGNLVITTNNPHTLTGLMPQGEYRYYVRSICSVGDTSFWSTPYTLTTLCSPFTAPWLDDVETHTPTTNSTIENCWSSSPSNTSSAFRWDMRSGPTTSTNTGPSAAFSGQYYFYTEASSGSQGDIAELYTPMIDASALNVPELLFYYHMYGVDIGTLYIDAFDGTNWVVLDSIVGEQQTSTTTPWLKRNIVINGFPDTLQVRFRGSRGPSYDGDIAIDDIEIREAPTCPQPIALNVSNLTMNSAAFSWTEVGSATNWQIEWGLSGFTLGGGVRLMTTTNPYTQIGLQPATTYDFYVRSVCTVGDSSFWSGPYTFSTPICNPSQQCNYTFRMTDSFGDGWNGNTMDIIQNGITVATIGSTFTSGAGPINISIPLCINYPFDLFWNTGGSFNTEIGIQIKDADNAVIFTHNPGTDLSGTTLYSDSVFCPSCPAASNLGIIALSATSVDLSWTVNSTATSWQVEWDTTGFVQGTGNIAITSNNPYNVSGLTPGGFYQFYVRDICTIGDTSNWSGPYAFMAPCMFVTSYPYFEDFENGRGCWIEDNTNNGSWGFGTPAMTVINGAASGSNAFATGNLNSTYNPNENSWVTSPNFDFTNANNPKIEMKIWWNSEFSWDGAVLQSSIDNGNSWQNVGAFGDTVNWYTDNSLGGNPGGQQEGWTGRNSTNNGSGTWVTASHMLYGLNNKGNVILRIAFGADGSVQDEGFAFDDVHIFDVVCPYPVNIGNDTTICSTDSLLLDAGVGYTTYQWSDSLMSTSQTLVVDSTTFGVGIHTIYVTVTDSVSNCLTRDTIVVEITTCVGIDEHSPTIDMLAYPNPNKGQFTLNLTTQNTTDLQIRITNIHGQEVYVKNNFDNINVINEIINIGNIKGVYFVNIITNNEVITKKIIVQ